MNRRHVFLVLALSLAVGACAPWRRTKPGDLGDLPPDKRVQVWSGGMAPVYHGVRIVGDSLSGVPYLLSPSCDSCRVTIALASVDSLRTFNQEVTTGKVMRLAGLVIVGSALVYFVWLLTHFPSD